MKLREYISVLLISLLLLALLYGFFKVPLPEMDVSLSEPLFDEEYAAEFQSDFQNSFPGRHIYHHDGREAATWLRSRFFDFRLPYTTQKFAIKEREGVVEVLQNVYGYSEGATKSDEIIIVVSHFDIPIVNDREGFSAHGVAVNAELARIFSKDEHSRSIIFLFTDSKYGGMMEGVRHFIKTFDELDKIAAVLVIDPQEAGDGEGISFLPMGFGSGFSPLWLREIASKASLAEGFVAEASFFREWIMRTFPVSPSEAGFFLQKDIPALSLRWSVAEEEPEKENAAGVESVNEESVASLAEFGRAAERILRSLDELDEAEKTPRIYLKTGNSYFPVRLIYVMHLFLIIPLIYAIYSGYKQRSQISGFPGTLKREIFRWLKLSFAALSAYLLLRFLSFSKPVNDYEAYLFGDNNPLFKDPLLIFFLLLPAIMAGIYYFLKRLFRKYALPLTWDWEGARLSMLIILLSLYLLFWIGGSAYFATIIMLSPLFLWPLIGESRRRRNRFINLFLMLPGLFIFMLTIRELSIMTGISSIWRLFLTAAAQGLISPFNVFVFVGSVSIYIIAFTVAWHSAPPETISEAGLNK